MSPETTRTLNLDFQKANPPAGIRSTESVDTIALLLAPAAGVLALFLGISLLL